MRKIITGKTIAEIVGEILTREMQKDIASLRLLSNANVVMRPDDVEGQRIS